MWTQPPANVVAIIWIDEVTSRVAELPDRALQLHAGVVVGALLREPDEDPSDMRRRV
jgi:hypothetical protein